MRFAVALPHRLKARELYEGLLRVTPKGSKVRLLDLDEAWDPAACPSPYNQLLRFAAQFKKGLEPKLVFPQKETGTGVSSNHSINDLTVQRDAIISTLEGDSLQSLKRLRAREDELLRGDVTGTVDAEVALVRKEISRVLRETSAHVKAAEAAFLSARDQVTDRERIDKREKRSRDGRVNKLLQDKYKAASDTGINTSVVFGG